MSSTLEVLEAEVMMLPPAQRSHLLERLVTSLDLDPEVEEAWERLSIQRESEIDSGAVRLVDGPDTMARLRSKLVR
jgi:hypothetical protein